MAPLLEQSTINAIARMTGELVRLTPDEQAIALRLLTEIAATDRGLDASVRSAQGNTNTLMAAQFDLEAVQFTEVCLCYHPRSERDKLMIAAAWLSDYRTDKTVHKREMVGLLVRVGAMPRADAKKNFSPRLIELKQKGYLVAAASDDSRSGYRMTAAGLERYAVPH